MSDSRSFMFVSKKKASGTTVFSAMHYASPDCSGSPVSPTLVQVPGTYDLTNMATQGNTTIPQGDTSMVCAPSGLSNPGMAYVTVLYGPVLSFASGWGVGHFNSRGACDALNTTQLFSGTHFTNGCVRDAMTVSNYLAVAGCPGDGDAAAGRTGRVPRSWRHLSRPPGRCRHARAQARAACA
jgi:hypothetical protein